MSPGLASNIKLSEHDRPTNTPRLSLEIEPSRTLYLEDPRGIIVTVRRAEDDCLRPCIFRWSVMSDAWGPGGFVLFQHTSDGLKKLERKNMSPPPRTLKLEGWEVETEELLPGQALQRNIGSLFLFRNQLVAGERYELFWPGAEYGLWAWGTLREHWNQEIGVNLGLPPVILPGGACCSLTVVDGVEVLESQPEDPRVEISDRIPGTPCICVRLEGPSKITKTERNYVLMSITYDGLTNEDFEAVSADAKPIIIHNYTFGHDNFRLHRRCHDYNPSETSDGAAPEWEPYFDDHWNLRPFLVEGPDVEVHVTDDTFFLSLQPGESWNEWIPLEFSDLHPDTTVGDTYRFQYWGGCIDWWTWGDQEHLANKVVKLPCFLDGTVDPADNEGRPGIMVPASNILEFTVTN